MMNNRQENIQALRALAIFAVVLIHTCPLGMWQVLCRPLINFSVALFTFLSGYLTREEKIIDWKTFYTKRIVKIAVPYVAWTILYTVSGGGRNNKYELILNLLTGRAAAPLYYSLVYIQLVLITPVLFKMMKIKWHWFVWLLSPIAMIFLKYVWILSGTETNYYFSAFSGAFCFIWIDFYYLGLMLGNERIRKIEQKLSYRNLILYYVIAIALQIVEGYFFFQLGESNCGTQGKLTSLITSFIFCLLVYVYLKSNSKFLQWKWIILIGNCSYGIYLSHMMIIKVLYHVPAFEMYIPYPITGIIVIVCNTICICFGKKICPAKFLRLFGLV